MIGAGAWLIYNDKDFAGLGVIGADVLAFYKIYMSGHGKAGKQ